MKTVTFSKILFDELYMNGHNIPSGYTLAPPHIQLKVFEILENSIMYIYKFHTSNFSKNFQQVIEVILRDCHNDHIVIVNHQNIDTEITFSSYNADFEIKSNFLEELKRGISRNVYYDENFYMLKEL